MSKSLQQALDEAKNSGGIHELLTNKCVKHTKIPPQLSKLKYYLYNQGEFELYSFLDHCSFFEVLCDDLGGSKWYHTMAVAPINDERVAFFYDADFLKKLSSNMGELVFVIAHEFSHIMRYHLDRVAVTNKNDPQLYNIASDMIINNGLIKNQRSIGNIDLKLVNGALTIPKKIDKKLQAAGRDAYYTENLYSLLENNPPPGRKGKKKKKKPINPKIREGDIVFSKDDNKYYKVNKINNDKAELEEVDIEKIKREARGNYE